MSRFFNSGMDQETEVLATLMADFWAQCTTAAVPPGPKALPLDGYGHGQRVNTDDPSQFIMYLFQRIAGYDIPPDQVDPVNG